MTPRCASSPLSLLVLYLREDASGSGVLGKSMIRPLQMSFCVPCWTRIFYRPTPRQIPGVRAVPAPRLEG